MHIAQHLETGADIHAESGPGLLPAIRALLTTSLLRPRPPSLRAGIVVATSLIVVEAIVFVFLQRTGRNECFGVVFVPAVVVISMLWRIELAVATVLLSVVVLGYVQNWPAGSYLENGVAAITSFLIAGLSTNFLARLARAGAAEADQHRREADQLADQQASLRRLATLVARGVSPPDVFAAVAEEMAGCLGATDAKVCRCETEGEATVVGSYSERESDRSAVGDRLTPEEGSVSSPIVVDEHLWGVALVSTSQPEPLPPDTEQRITEFADLVAMAIAASSARADLLASRARIVAAADDARRRVERDLHDGAQQRLVSLSLRLSVAHDSTPAELHELRQDLSDVMSGLGEVSKELQEISRGIHPAILSTGGLKPALRALARRSAVPVSLDVDIGQPLPETVEVAAYYVVAEALANTVKHARASAVDVHARTSDLALHMFIRDDGIGGADARNGSGLVGLNDRIEALRGHLAVTSPVGAGTWLQITLPLGSSSAPAHTTDLTRTEGAFQCICLR